MCPAALGCALLWPSLLASRPLHSLELALSLQLADQRCRGPGVVRISKHRPTRLPNQPNQPPQLAASPQTMPSIGPSAPLAVTAFTQAHLDRVLAAADESGGACAPQAATAKLLSLFQLAQSTVPAYKDFVRQQRQQQAAEVQGEGEGAEGGGGGGGGGGASRRRRPAREPRGGALHLQGELRPCFPAAGALPGRQPGRGRLCALQQRVFGGAHLLGQERLGRAGGGGPL